MIERTLSESIFSPQWGRQMRFIAGPRQSGKTTLAKEWLKSQGDLAFYYNWDDRALRSRFHHQHDFLKEDFLKAGTQKRHWVCYDEIHKMPGWKNILKAHFDAHEENTHFVITGSARLDLFRRSGDSLAGRYFLFHLFPLNLFELSRKSKQKLEFHSSAQAFIESRIARREKETQSNFEGLFHFGGFPEPFLKGEDSFLKVWHRGYMDRLVREDLRDLTRIGSLENVAALMALLPARVGSPLSLNSLREDLGVSHETVQNYLRALKLCYFIFEVPVYSKKISRSIKKEKKFYFHDWSFIPEEAARFENYAAAELSNWISVWHDAGVGDFSLHYLRNREGKECDFLIVKDGAPWFLVETKLKDREIHSSLPYFSRALGNLPAVQLVRQKGVLQASPDGIYCVSASRFFGA